MKTLKVMTIKNIIVALVVVLVKLPSQSQDFDSLKYLLHDKEGTERIRVLYQLADGYIEDDPDLALRFSREGYTLAMQSGDSLGIVENGSTFGASFRRLQKVDSAIIIYNSYLPIAKRLKHWKYSIGLNGLGISYMFQADYDKALDCFYESLELRKMYNDTSDQIVVLQNIGIVYYKLKNYEKALELFIQCHDMQERSGDFKGADLVLLNAGHACVYLGKYEQAMNYVDLALKYCAKSCIPERRMQGFFAKGLINHGLGNDVIAERLFLESYAIAQGLEDIRFQLDNIDYLSRIYMDQGNFDDAAFYLKAGEELIRDYSSFKLENIKLFARFSELYRYSKFYRLASDYQFKHASLKDSVYSDKLINNLMRIEAEYLEKSNLDQIASQQQIISLNEDIMRRQNAISILSIILALISAGFVLILYRNYQQKKRLNDLLDGKIGERTRQLNRSHEQLMKALQERDWMLMREGRINHELINRLESLCRIGLKEVSDPIARAYILKIDALAKEGDKISRQHDRSIRT